ncbi:MAG: 2,3-bisphosphoglycerate-independent phosphoglycerate mutase [Patescibacteria group bacterium]
MKANRPFLLLILDGWGIAPASKGNAINLAKTPVIDRLSKKYPHTTLCASGPCAGLPKNQVGNSEAGHMNIGSGRVVDQEEMIITESVDDGTFFRNPAFIEAVNHVKRNKTSLHIMGLLTYDQSPHADPEHLMAIIKLARQHHLPKVVLHLFTDGRDSPQFAAIKIVKDLEKKLYSNEMIATIMGRFYAMDRNKAWKRTEKAYNAMVLGKGIKAGSAEEAILHAYNRKETDEYIQPTILMQDHKPPQTIQNGDSIIFFNFRSDRARQITKAFVQKKFNKMNPGSFIRKKALRDLRFIAMTDFGPDLDNVLTAFPSEDLEETLPMQLADLKQLYTSESEKFAHVTYFFNGGYADPVGGESRIMIPSPSVESYAEVPEMNIEKLTKAVLKHIKNDEFDFITCNFPNPDMVGHTGNLKAGIQAAEAVDKHTGLLVREVQAKNGKAIITADHGNLENMINLKTQEVHTEHTTNPVPFIVVSQDSKGFSLGKKGILANIAPTILDLMERDIPKQMKSKSLIRKKAR